MLNVESLNVSPDSGLILISLITGLVSLVFVSSTIVS